MQTKILAKFWFVIIWFLKIKQLFILFLDTKIESALLGLYYIKSYFWNFNVLSSVK